jgi:hypothetical protein
MNNIDHSINVKMLHNGFLLTIILYDGNEVFTKSFLYEQFPEEIQENLDSCIAEYNKSQENNQ